MDLYRRITEHPSCAAGVPQRAHAVRVAIAAHCFRLRTLPAQRADEAQARTRAALQASLQQEAAPHDSRIARRKSRPAATGVVNATVSIREQVKVDHTGNKYSG